MKNTESKEKLLTATIELLTAMENPAAITARQIAAKAEANLAMINYYYTSKDALVNLAIDQIIQDAAHDWKKMIDESLPPKEMLKQMLIGLSDMVIKYYNYTQISIRYEIEKNEITLPYYILPLIKTYYGDRKSTFELKLMAFQMISFMQLTFLKSEEFQRYTGENILDKETRDRVIQMQIDLYLCGGENEQ